MKDKRKLTKIWALIGGSCLLLAIVIGMFIGGGYFSTSNLIDGIGRVLFFTFVETALLFGFSFSCFAIFLIRVC